MKLEFLNKTDRKISKSFFAKWAKKAEKVVAARIRELCGKKAQLVLTVTLVNDAEMAPLHEEWRGKKGPTDVLSFSFVEKGIEHKNPESFPVFRAPENLLTVGDIVISLDTIERQAKKHGWKFEQELQKMFVHSFLHIFGYDHETQPEFEEMEFFAGKILGSQQRIFED